MKKKEDFFQKLEKHPTKSIQDSRVNGSLTVIWRDYDNKIKNLPKMVYLSSVNPGEIKGPHVHTKRNSYFVCIHGKVIFVIKNSEMGKALMGKSLGQKTTVTLFDTVHKIEILSITYSI